MFCILPLPSIAVELESVLIFILFLQMELRRIGYALWKNLLSKFRREKKDSYLKSMAFIIQSEFKTCPGTNVMSLMKMRSRIWSQWILESGRRLWRMRMWWTKYTIRIQFSAWSQIACVTVGKWIKMVWEVRSKLFLSVYQIGVIKILKNIFQQMFVLSISAECCIIAMQEYSRFHSEV